MDDELNILPISSHIRSIAPVTSEQAAQEHADLTDLKGWVKKAELDRTIGFAV